jgi:hypothetical protein
MILVVYLTRQQTQIAPTPKELDGSSQIHNKRKGKNTRTKRLQIFSKTQTKIEANQKLWVEPTTLPQITR